MGDRGHPAGRRRVQPSHGPLATRRRGRPAAGHAGGGPRARRHALEDPPSLRNRPVRLERRRHAAHLVERRRRPPEPHLPGASRPGVGHALLAPGGVRQAGRGRRCRRRRLGRRGGLASDLPGMAGALAARDPALAERRAAPLLADAPAQAGAGGIQAAGGAGRRGFVSVREARRLPRLTRGDVIAGVSVALVLVPQSLAYAQLAGMPASRGYYAAVLPPIAAALLASSPYLQTGPVALTSLLAFGALSALATPGSDEYVALGILLALVVGVARLAVGLLRAGVVAYLVSQPMLLGFLPAAAILIVAAQLPTALGTSPPEGGVLRQAGWSLGHPADWDTTSLALSLATIVLVVGGWRLHRFFPGVLLAVGIGPRLQPGDGLRRSRGRQHHGGPLRRHRRPALGRAPVAPRARRGDRARRLHRAVDDRADVRGPRAAALGRGPRVREPGRRQRRGRGRRAASRWAGRSPAARSTETPGRRRAGAAPSPGSWCWPSSRSPRRWPSFRARCSAAS